MVSIVIVPKRPEDEEQRVRSLQAGAEQTPGAFWAIADSADAYPARQAEERMIVAGERTAVSYAEDRVQGRSAALR
jgi:hypothetical protein